MAQPSSVGSLLGPAATSSDEQPARASGVRADRSAARTAPPTASPRRRTPVMVFVGLVASLLVAMLCNGILDLLQSGGDVGRLFGYSLDEARFLFLISSLVLWCVLAVLIAVTGRFFLPAGLFVVAALLVGFANHQKLVLRQEPIYPSDLAFAGEAGFLTAMVGPATVVLLATMAALVLLVFALLGRILSRTFPPIRRRTEPRLWRRVLVARALLLGIGVSGLVHAADFNSTGNRLRTAYDASGAQWAFWFQKVNYARNGFVAGLLYNLDGPAMAVPADYGRATMEELAARWTERADRRNAGRPADALDDVNVVVVLSEALSDPTTVDGVELAEDPLPFLRGLSRRTTSGQMLAQLFGGGTANMEFEALTGMSLSQFLPQMNTPYQMLVTETPTFPSVVGYLRGRGHVPVAVHPYLTSMYKRYAVYPTLGFTDFVHEETMHDPTYLGDNEFVADAAAFDEVVRQLEASEAPAFVNLVTMQNHYPMAGIYGDPIPATGVSGDVEEELTHYARGLRHTDDALREFVGRLRRSSERTALVVYGDHAPAFWSGDVYERNGEDAFRRTPYFMWTNFERLPAANAPVTSPIYFLPALFDALGAPLPPYYTLLQELSSEIAAMEQGEYFLPDGTAVAEQDLPARAQRLLRDYRLVQYDLAVGERYAQDALFYPED